jgi:4-amino-4-deoxy-L-arabinose transferase-like glycosyltransferase
MSIRKGDLADQAQSRMAGIIHRLGVAAGRLLAETDEGAVAATIIGLFAILWMAYHSVSLAPVDLRDDASEAALWARHFAFGYKHPPMTAWLFMLWFALFPRTNWAMHLEAVVIVAITLAITWRLCRDHLDRNRSLFGLAALILVPFYTFRADELNASTVMMPFWAAALLFFLRARRGLGVVDSLSAGVCASLAMLGKYWAVYLFVGMGAASLVGDARRFWRSPAPYLMALGAAVTIAPHLYWYAAHAGGTDYAFIRNSVMTSDPFVTALGKSLSYLLGAVAYVAGPLILLAALRPGRAALADIAWPADAERRQAVLLLVVPIVLPALVNLVVPHRVTSVWAFPNWALLPVVLYGSRKVAIDSFAAAGAGLIALGVSLASVAAAPLVAYAQLEAGLDHNRPSSQEVAHMAQQLTHKSIQLYWGSPGITGNLSFYLPGSAPLASDPLSPAGRAEIARHGLLLACLDTDVACRAKTTSLASVASHVAHGVIARTFLGFSGPRSGFQLTVVPAGR